MRSITLKWLKSRNVYKGHLKIFEEKFGRKASIKQIIDYLHEIENPRFEGWLMAQKLKLTTAMIDNGADIHDAGREALWLAAKYGRLEIIKFLVEKGADIHADDDFILLLAAEHGRLEIIKFLVEKGVDIHARDDWAMRWARINDHSGIIEFLQNSG